MPYSIESKGLGRGRRRRVVIDAKCPACGLDLLDPHGKYLGVVEGACPDHGVVLTKPPEPPS